METLGFSKGVSPWLWLKIGNFSIFLLLIGKKDKENVFKSVQERKKAFPDYRKYKLKKSKISDFSKGISPWIWLKIGNFFIL